MSLSIDSLIIVARLDPFRSMDQPERVSEHHMRIMDLETFGALLSYLCSPEDEPTPLPPYDGGEPSSL